MDVHGALADPIRRDLLRRLAGGPVRVVDLAADHDVSRPAISRHLRVLSTAGLVRATVDGRERHYSLDVTPLADVQRFLDELAGHRPLITSQHLDALDTETHRAKRDRRRTPKAPNYPNVQERTA